MKNSVKKKCIGTCTDGERCKCFVWKGQYCRTHHPELPRCNWCRGCKRTDVNKYGLCDYHANKEPF